MMSKGKGLVYKATMVMGFGLLGMQAYGETAYWKYHRKERDEQFERVSELASVTHCAGESRKEEVGVVPGGAEDGAARE